MTKTTATPIKAAKPLFPPWAPFTAVALVFGVYFGASLCGEAVLLIYGFIRRWSVQQLDSWLNTSTVAQFVNVVVVYGLMALAILLFMKRYKTPLRTLLRGIGVVRPRFRDIGKALLAIPV